MPGGGRQYCRECLIECRFACYVECPPGSSKGEVFRDVDQCVVDFFVQEGDVVLVG